MDMLTLFVILSSSLLSHLNFVSTSKVVCYWDTSSVNREGHAKFGQEELRQYIPSCTHLIAGIIDLRDEFQSFPELDQYQTTSLAQIAFMPKPAGFKVYLGVGCLISFPRDCEPRKYSDVIKEEHSRNRLINDMVEVVKSFGLDGVDLSWPFPTYYVQNGTEVAPNTEPGPSHSFLGVRKLQYTRLSGHPLPNTLPIQKDFMRFLTDLHQGLKNEFKDLTITVLPHSFTRYYDMGRIHPLVEAIHLLSFDYRTPYLQNHAADFTAPLSSIQRDQANNIKRNVRVWKEQVPTKKLILVISTFARTWWVDPYVINQTELKPPFPAYDVGDEGPLTHTKGMLAQYEACYSPFYPYSLATPAQWIGRFGLINTDPDHLRGAWRIGLSPVEAYTWATFDAFEMIANKVLYALDELKFGGVGIYEISLDDFRSICWEGSVLENVHNALENFRANLHAA